MKILYIHTYYRERGGEDIVYENERKLVEQGGFETDAVLFDNKRFAILKFIFLFFNPFSFIRVYRTINSFKPDVVHVHNWFFGASPSVFWAAKLKRVPVIHTIHNFRILCPSGFLFNKGKLFTDCVSKIFPFQAIRMKVYRDSTFYTCWLLICTRLNYLFGTWKQVNRFICLTKSSKNILCESFMGIASNKVVVKPNFFKVNDYSHDPINTDSRAPAFLFVGRLSPEKGIDVMLTAFNGSTHSLTIIGSGPLQEDVEKCAAANSNITYLGFLQKESIIMEMRKFSAVIFPSIGYEQFGLVIIEALSCGTPVIASDIGSPAELISEGVNGLHFKAGDSCDLLRNIEKWRSFPEKVKHAYYQNALDTYNKHFTAENNFTQLSSIYKSLKKK